jgi:hypothetical protein
MHCANRPCVDHLAATDESFAHVWNESPADEGQFYSHSRRKAKRAAQDKVLQHLVLAAIEMREPQTIQQQERG